MEVVIPESLRVVLGVFIAIAVGTVLFNVCYSFLTLLPSLLISLLTAGLVSWMWYKLTGVLRDK